MPTSQHAPQPHLILHGGRIRAMAPGGEPGAPFEAVATAGDRVVAMGRSSEVLARRGPRTRVIDLRGRTALPGFTDAHCHPLGGGLKRIECALDRVDGAEALIVAVRDYAAAHPDLEWIVGDGWSLDAFPGGIPRREALDAVVPDRPVFLYNRDGHGAWVNSRALEIAGVTAETPDPPNGRIERDPDGTPVGMLQEMAIDLVFDHIPPYPSEVLEDALLDAQAQLHAWGITGWIDANIDPRLLAAYRAIAGRGQLTARAMLSLNLGDLDTFGGIAGLVTARDAVAADAHAADAARPGLARLAAGTIKIFTDGILENFTGAMLDPYLDADGQPTRGVGTLAFEPDRLRALSAELDRHGFQLHYHAIGDRATREALNAIEAARSANGVRDARHHIAHLQVIHPADVPRFAALEVVANAQPLWAVHETQMDELTIPFLGAERATWQYPFGSLHRAGARLAFGSDWTVSTAEPFPQLEVAVRRIWPESPDAEAFLPAERLTLEDALRAFTVGSAFVSRQDEAGWLGEGRLADLVVLDRDLDDVDLGRAGDLAATRILGTIVGGEVVFEDPALEA
jgi:predicted amidohydrolase YtcJ